MKIISKRLSKEDVRGVCIRHDYYTAGTCQEYENMFSILDKETPQSHSNISSHRLEMIAVDIKEHSHTDDTVEDIMENLVCHIKCSLVDLDD